MKTDPVLARRGWWLALAWSAVALIIALSLAPTLPRTGVTHGDKLAHLVAYAALGFGFASLYRRSRHLAIVTALVALGVTLEFLQGMSATRFASIADGVANTLGTVFGVGLSRMGGNALLPWIERLLGLDRQRA